jgi:hypothetical protein
MKTIIHVNQHVIKANAKNGTNDPVLTVKNYKENRYAHEVTINGPSKVVYSEKPLSCGARVWIETQAEVLCTQNGYEHTQTGSKTTAVAALSGSKENT